MRLDDPSTFLEEGIGPMSNAFEHNERDSESMKEAENERRRTRERPCTFTEREPKDLVNSDWRSYQCGENTMFWGRYSGVHDEGQNWFMTTEQVY